jgi:hypothetical protein
MYRNSVETNVVGGITLNGFLSQVYPHTLLPSYCCQHLCIRNPIDGCCELCLRDDHIV